NLPFAAFSLSLSENVRLSKSLNPKEEEYVKGRQAVVEKFLTFLLVPHSLLQEHVPVIAVLGSGGGERAVVGLLGSLAQMAEKKLLDSITYLCGVSGSTWCMASLYEDPCWSLKVPTNKDKLMERLSDGEFNISEMLDWLNEAVEDENYSLTDFWAATVVYRTVKKIDRHHLSEQKDRDTTNPYPIYTAIDKGMKEDHQKTYPWFEVSPHEAGYTHVGAYVTTSLFGSQFEEGIVKKQTEEKDMLYLQGLCGSALADILHFLLNTAAKIITKTIVALCSWTWGTKFNFLHNYSVEGSPVALVSDEKRYLMDAGLLLNSPYVAALRPERKVDLILSFDFIGETSVLTLTADYCKEAGVPFPTVVIPAGEEDKPKDFYVFKDGEKAPIVIHIPLFNTVSCGGLEWRNNYKTFQLPYDRKKIEEVLSISSLNVKNNKQQIIAEIQAVCTD
uniref:PLA2c domain-containing protein n=1 Tax=Scleropages formosus TaxID=113540 RepID=A0A8C9SYD7_SCLFO